MLNAVISYPFRNVFEYFDGFVASNKASNAASNGDEHEHNDWWRLNPEEESERDDDANDGSYDLAGKAQLTPSIRALVTFKNCQDNIEYGAYFFTTNYKH